jgi:hypothetical protein
MECRHENGECKIVSRAHAAMLNNVSCSWITMHSQVPKSEIIDIAGIIAFLIYTQLRVIGHLGGKSNGCKKESRYKT